MKKKTALLLNLILFLSMLLPGSQSYAQQTAPDLNTYTQWVREALAAARRNDRLGLEASAEPLMTTTQIRLSDGSLIGVDNSWLQRALAENPPDINSIASRLGALTDALSPPDTAAPEDALERIQKILNAPPYAQQEAAPPPSWLTSFFEWLGRILEALLRPLIGPVTNSSATPMAWCVIIIGVLLIAGLLLYLLRGLRRGMIASAEIVAPTEEKMSSAAAVHQASQLAQSGDYRMAMRYLYLTALLRLDERKLLRYDRALTNREYLARLRENPGLVAALEPVIEAFDRVWYGHVPIDEQSFQSYWQQVDKLKELS